MKIIWPAAIVLLAAALRLLGLEHLPPGLFYDESANGIDALRVLEGVRPVFFTGNQGREPLFIYLQAITMALIGPSPLALRLPSAFVGILTVASAYTTFRALLGRSAGLIGAFLLATIYWHISLSRLGFRAVVLPLLVSLATFWLWKGLQTASIRSFAIAGACLGLAIYTYIPSRAAPVLLGAWFIGCVIIARWRAHPSIKLIRGGAVAVLAFTLVTLPIARYWVAHPADFTGRATTAQRPLRADSLIEGMTEATRALIWDGDPNPRHNLPGRPLLDAPTVAATILGVAMMLRNRSDSTSLLALVWVSGMIAPAALSYEPAHALRLVGELPFILLFPACGYDWIRRQRWFNTGWIGPTAITLALAGSAFMAARDYFVVWPSHPETYDRFQSDLRRLMDLIPLVPSGQPIMATADIYENRPIPLSFTPSPNPDLRAFDGRSNFIVPAASSGSIFYLIARTFEPAAGLPRLPNFREIYTSQDRFGRTEERIFRLDPPFSLPRAQHPAEATIGPAVLVTGTDFASNTRPGQRLSVALHWTVRGSLPPGRWEFFAHLVGRSDQRLLAEDYNFGFPAPQWRDGDQVISWFSLPVPEDTPTGLTEVHLGIFNRETGQRLPLRRPGGEPAGDALRIGPIRIDRPSAVPAPEYRLALRFGDQMVLDGYDLSRSADGAQTIRLHWRAEGPIARDYTVFAHRLDREGKFLVAADSEPGGGAFPTSTWVPGEAVLDPHVLPPAPGSDRIEVGVYLLATGERLPLTDLASGQARGDALTLAEQP